jgi:hypothetical protein
MIATDQHLFWSPFPVAKRTKCERCGITADIHQPRITADIHQPAHICGQHPDLFEGECAACRKMMDEA